MHDPNLAEPAAAARARNLPTPFQMFRYMTGSEHLHFGLFEHVGETVSVAQDRMMRRVLSSFPSAVERVLDVGCGIGGTTCELAARGMYVVAFAPDQGLIDSGRALAEERGVSDHTEFYVAGLQDLPRQGIEPFDVVLSQESLQYIHPLDETMGRLHDLLRPRGRLVIGDQVLRDPRGRASVQFHTSADILSEAASHGLSLLEHQDVTEMARHTGPVTLAILQQEKERIIEFFADQHPQIREDVEVCLRNGGEEAQWFVEGQIGYELFSFERS